MRTPAPPYFYQEITAPDWRRQWRSRVVYLWPLKALGTALFITLFFQAYFHVLHFPSRPAWVMPLTWADAWVPFTPLAFGAYAALWVYVSLPPALLGSFAALVRFTWWVLWLCLTGLGLFWLFPTQVPPAGIDWTLYPSLAFLKSLDAAGNACPSLHVATAVYVASWLHQLGRVMAAPAAWGWCNGLCCLAIVWSTLATRQHVALDALAGALLGALFAWLSLRRAQRLLCACPT